MEWVWPVMEYYVRGKLRREGRPDPDEATLQAAFIETLAGCSVTVLVQEPWQGSVRFKGLARYEGPDMFPLLNDPEGFLLSNFGGGKFKLNFHEGWNFAATHNFKPEGTPRWEALPGIPF